VTPTLVTLSTAFGNSAAALASDKRVKLQTEQKVARVPLQKHEMSTLKGSLSMLTAASWPPQGGCGHFGG
jgi:hypothetical protein